MEQQNSLDLAKMGMMGTGIAVAVGVSMAGHTVKTTRSINKNKRKAKGGKRK